MGNLLTALYRAYQRVDWTRLLPKECRLLIVKRMDTDSRAAWRQANKQACQDVYESTERLKWRSDVSYGSDPDSLPLVLLSRLLSLHSLDCSGMNRLRSIKGIPHSLRSLILSSKSNVLDFRPLLPCSMLEQLILCGNYDYGALAETLATVTPALGSCLRNLRMFLSPSEPYTPTSGWALLRSLAPLTRLQQLALRPQGVEPSEWQRFADVLSCMTDLQHLNMSCSTIGSSMASLAPAIGQLKQLRSLRLAEVVDFGNEGAAAKARAMVASSAQLVELRLGWGGIGADSAAALAPALQAHSTTLKVLDLQYNDLRADGMQALARGLRHCTALVELNLASNSISDQGAAALAYCLPALAPSLTFLNLSGNRIGSAGAAALTRALGVMKSLETLRFSGNLLGPEGLRVLVPVLYVLKWSLRTCDIRDNSLGRAGGKFLASQPLAMSPFHFWRGPRSVRLYVSASDVGYDSYSLVWRVAQSPYSRISIDHGKWAARAG